MPEPSPLSLADDLAFLATERRAVYLDRVTDIPASTPRHRLALRGAGVARQTIELRIDSLLDGPAQLVGDLSLETTLPPERRGVHMSRFVEVAARLAEQDWATLEKAAEGGVRSAAERQGTDRAKLDFSASTIVWRDAPATGRRSPDPFRIGVSAELDRDTLSVTLRLGASVMTACPCTAAYSHHSARLDLADVHGDELAQAVMDGVLTYTHSQRAEVDVTVEAVGGLGLRDCLAALEQATTMTHELLKRPDEHALVRRAHERPQFTEDVVRDVAAALADTAPSAARCAVVSVTARALESIHAHDVCARFVGSIGDVIGALDA